MAEHRKECRGFNEPWHAHALTFTCFHHLRLLEPAIACQLLADSLDRARRQQGFDLWGYVFMPDHVHLIVMPQNEVYDISRFLSAVKRPMSFRAMKQGLCEGRHFWQAGGGYDRNLTKVETVHKELEYIHANPVRRALCASADDWRYSSAAFYAGQANVPLRMDVESLPPRK